jgi:hypothetical protein
MQQVLFSHVSIANIRGEWALSTPQATGLPVALERAHE